MPTLFDRFKKSANDAISDYSQLKDAYPNVKNFGNALKKSIDAHIPSNEDFQSPERMSEWSQSAALNAPMLGTFTGPKSIKWDKEKAAMAAKLLDEGVNPAQVWKDHLIGRLPSGHLFSEIDDSVASLNMMNIPESGENLTNLKSILNHPNLMKQYDYISEHPISLHQGKQHFNEGSAIGGSNGFITIKGQNENIKPTLFHELQHTIQDKEGWPVGGSPVNNSSIALDVYRRLTGEAQARATQNRMNMDMEARRNNYPMADDKLDDVPLGRLIDRYGSGDQRSIADLPETEFSQAHKIAQEHAALPVKQGGLGLPPDNTAMDRAWALGFDLEGYHQTDADIKRFLNNKLGLNTVANASSKALENTSKVGHWFSAEPLSKSTKDYNFPGNTTYPVVIKSEWPEELSHTDYLLDKLDYYGLKGYKEKLKADDNHTIIIKRDYETGLPSIVETNPKNIRSRFAAFDPFKKDSANILASVLAGTTLASQLRGKNDSKRTK